MDTIQTQSQNLTPTTHQKKPVAVAKTKTVTLHLPENVNSLRDRLNGLSVDELVKTALQHGQSRHDTLGLGNNRTSVVITEQTEHLVSRFAERHCLSNGNALDILVWSGLQYRHGQSQDYLPEVVAVPEAVDILVSDRAGKVLGRPKTGQGRVCDLRLPEELDFRLRDYGSRYAALVRKWMQSYVENPVPFKDCTGALSGGLSTTPLRVSLLPWQERLLGDIEISFGCTRSQALIKILVAVGVL